MLDKPHDWVDSKQLISDLQAGFKLRVSTIGQVFHFFLIHCKYVLLRRELLYVSFIDLRAAFELVPRATLWELLRSLGIPEQLLKVLICLQHDNYTQVKLRRNGELTYLISVQRDVR